MNTDEIKAATAAVEQIAQAVTDNYRASPALLDSSIITTTINAAVMIYCANIIAKAIYSTGPV